MSRKTVLFNIEKELGASFEIRPAPGPEGQGSEWELAARFSTPEEECRAVRTAVGLMDLCYRGKIEITGPDRVRYLNGVVTNDIKKLTPGQGCYACALDYKGALIGDLKIYSHPDCLMIDTGELCTYKLFDHFLRFAISDEVEILDKSSAIAHLGLHGPRSADLLQQLVKIDVSSLREFEFVSAPFGNTAIEIIRQDYTGEKGFDLFMQSEDAPIAWEALFKCGASAGLKPVGITAFDILRLEAGIPIFGRDMTEDHLALEAGLMSAISTDKGCYTGQETVARIINRGHVNRILSGLQLKGSRIPAPGEKIFKNESSVGEITSAAFSPTLQMGIALGYVPALQAEAGNEFLVGEGPEAIAATVVQLPFYKRS